MTDNGPCQGNSIKKYPLLFYLRGNVVIFGGGKVGMRKAGSLLEHGLHVRVIDRSEVDCEEGISLSVCELDSHSFMRFIDGDTSLVVCALDDPELNDMITSYCMDRSILVNNATSKSMGNVAFPAVLDGGEDLVAVSSMATCPQCSYALKRYISRELPNLGTFSKLMHKLDEEGVLSRNLIAKVLDDQELLSLIRDGNYDGAIEVIRREHL